MRIKETCARRLERIIIVAGPNDNGISDSAWGLKDTKNLKEICEDKSVDFRFEKHWNDKTSPDVQS